MRKSILAGISLCLIAVASAQDHGLQIHLTGEAVTPAFQPRCGAAVSVNGLFRLGDHISLNVAPGIYLLHLDQGKMESTGARLIPFLLGCQVNFQGFTIEPQGGIGEMGGKEKFEGDIARHSVTAAYWGMKAGYQWKKFSAGTRFLAGQGISSPDAGSWHHKKINLFSTYFEYRIF
jgi:hypothetical protein